MAGEIVLFVQGNAAPAANDSSRCNHLGSISSNRERERIAPGPNNDKEADG